MVHKYKLSGGGAGQRAEDDSDYEREDIEQCVEGDDNDFLMESDVKETYLLYWLHKLDVDEFIQFTLCILDKFQRANASDFQLVSNVYSVNLPKKDKDKKDTYIAKNAKTVRAAINTLDIMTARRDMES